MRFAVGRDDPESTGGRTCSNSDLARRARAQTLSSFGRGITRGRGRLFGDSVPRTFDFNEKKRGAAPGGSFLLAGEAPDRDRFRVGPRRGGSRSSKWHRRRACQAAARRGRESEGDRLRSQSADRRGPGPGSIDAARGGRRWEARLAARRRGGSHGRPNPTAEPAGEKRASHSGSPRLGILGRRLGPEAALERGDRTELDVDQRRHPGGRVRPATDAVEGPFWFVWGRRGARAGCRRFPIEIPERTWRASGGAWVRRRLRGRAPKVAGPSVAKKGTA